MVGTKFWPMSTPATASTSRPRALAARAAMSAARYGPDRWPTCRGPLAVGGGIVITETRRSDMGRPVRGHRGDLVGRRPERAEDHERRVRREVAHRVPLVAVDEERVAVRDLDARAARRDVRRAADDDRQLELGM